jgi:hypothetical protein
MTITIGRAPCTATRTGRLTWLCEVCGQLIKADTGHLTVDHGQAIQRRMEAREREGARRPEDGMLWSPPPPPRRLPSIEVGAEPTGDQEVEEVAVPEVEVDRAEVAELPRTTDTVTTIRRCGWWSQLGWSMADQVLAAHHRTPLPPTGPVVRQAGRSVGGRQAVMQ